MPGSGLLLSQWATIISEKIDRQTLQGDVCEANYHCTPKYDCLITQNSHFLGPKQSISPLDWFLVEIYWIVL